MLPLLKAPPTIKHSPFNATPPSLATRFTMATLRAHRSFLASFKGIWLLVRGILHSTTLKVGHTLFPYLALLDCAFGICNTFFQVLEHHSSLEITQL